MKLNRSIRLKEKKMLKIKEILPHPYIKITIETPY